MAGRESEYLSEVIASGYVNEGEIATRFENEVSKKINALVYEYYELTGSEIENIAESITAY